MSWTDFWSSLPVGPTAPAFWYGKMTDDDEAQAPAAEPSLDTSDAPVDASAEDNKPKPLGFEDMAGFDPAKDAPPVIAGKKQAPGRIAYWTGDEVTEWADMSEKEINATKRKLAAAGYYGNKMPVQNGLRLQADYDAMAKAMADANRNGGIDWPLLLQRAGEQAAGGGGASGTADRVTLRADYAASVKELRGFAYDNGIRLPERFIAKKAAAIARGETSSEELLAHMRDKFVSRAYPAFAEEISAGMSVRDVAAPYVSSMATLLEIPEEQIDLQDPVMKRALQGVNDKGEPAYTPIWKFEEELKQDERWQYTDNAWDEVGANAYKVMQMFGMQA